MSKDSLLFKKNVTMMSYFSGPVRAFMFVFTQTEVKVSTRVPPLELAKTTYREG